MPPATLLMDAVLATATALLFAYVGGIALRRDVPSKDGRHAMRLFAVWWFGLALVTLLAAARSTLAFLGSLDLRTHALLGDLSLVPLVALLWGLVSYLAYVYTGSRRVFLPITVLHGAMLAFYAYVTLTRRPTGIRVEDWAVPLDYETTLSPAVTGIALVTLLLPTLVGAFAYGTLFFRTEDRSARYRIAMTSGAFLLWFGAAALAGITPLGDWYWWPLAARAIGLVATLMILAAYRPPRALRERFELRPIETRPRARDDERLRLAVAPAA